MLRWMIALGLAATPVAMPAAAQPGFGYAAPQTIKCESWNYRPAQCPVDLRRRNDVRLQRVIAGRCVEGETWARDRAGIRVSGGCRALFSVTSAGPDDGYPGGGRETVTCESFSYKFRACALPEPGRARLVRVVAGTCVEGQSWGGRRGEVWVDKGCRAIFATARGGGAGQIVTCESFKYRYAECATPSRRIELDSVIAGECVQGSSWGIADRGIWVDKGCRARFRTFG